MVSQVWWVTPAGTLQSAYFYEGDPWSTYMMPHVMPHNITEARTFRGSITSGGLAALGGSAEVTLYSNGGVRWKGHAHNSGADGYKFGVSAVLTDGQGHTIAFAHHGHVGGTFTSGSRDYDWNEYHPPHAVIADKLNSFIENGKFGLSTGYSSDIGSAALSALDFTATFLIGGGPVGSGFGLLIFIGALAGSWAVTGSAVPGARVVSGVLMFAGPSNTLLALAADSIASSGSQQRPIHKAEYDWANAEVFNYTLPPMDWLWITDTIGGGNRPFTFPQGEHKITINMGPAAYEDPRSFNVAGEKVYGEVFIHELVHAWQLFHSPTRVELLAEVLATKLCEAGGGYPYSYGAAGPPFGDFNMEQQASIVEDWWAGRHSQTRQLGEIPPKDLNSPYFRYVNGNIRIGQY
eukprot:jgi/Chrzof1/11503/UNPLg00435.t1